MGFDKRRLDAWVDESMPELWGIAQYIHAHPEVAFAEEKACATQREFLVKHGFAFEGNVAGLPTAYTATYGSDGPRLGIISEYDALPGLGHGCGHNLLGAGALGAAFFYLRRREEELDEYEQLLFSEDYSEEMGEMPEQAAEEPAGEE